MYSTPYGYPNAAGPTFNGAPPPPQQNLHLQPGHASSQPPQQMMYSPQQFAMAAATQGTYAGGPSMMPTAGPAGMMQNAALPPHMVPNGQMSYQTPYTTSPYGAPIPSPTVSQPQMQPGYSAMQGPMPGYPMVSAGMPHPQLQQQSQQQQRQQQQQQPRQQQHQQHQQHQQQMMQRAHPPQQNGPVMGDPGSQRSFDPTQGHPNHMPPHQPQFSPQHPQHPQQSAMQQQNPPPTSGAHPPHATVTTPQTPTFPHSNHSAGGNDGSAVQTPMSPGTESREKQRFAILLDINAELMYEAVQLQNTLLEHKKDNDVKGEDGNILPRELTEEEKPIHTDYFPCMRRLQTNLAYMATLVDPKSGSKLPCPAFLMAPTANFSIKLRNPTPKAADAENGVSDPQAEREERNKTLKELYSRLQALYPGIDYTKEPIYPIEKKLHGPGQEHTQGQQQQQRQERLQGRSNQASPAPAHAPAPMANRTPQMAPLPAPG